LRMRPGEEIIVISSRFAWRATLMDVDDAQARAIIVAPYPGYRHGELPVPITVLQAVPKGMKMDDVVEKVVELGAAAIQPIRCARSYGGDSRSKVERWQRIARAAAQQSHRLIEPPVEEPARLSDALAYARATGKVLVAYERAEPQSLASALRACGEQPLSIVVGPEGSFTDDELQLARDAGAALVSLGPTVLRTETAAAAMLAAVAALRGWW
jgi:16S rRNA (uracil1498-N3)-methyltransferase